MVLFFRLEFSLRRAGRNKRCRVWTHFVTHLTAHLIFDCAPTVVRWARGSRGSQLAGQPACVRRQDCWQRAGAGRRWRTQIGHRARCSSTRSRLLNKLSRPSAALGCCRAWEGGSGSPQASYRLLLLLPCAEANSTSSTIGQFQSSSGLSQRPRPTVSGRRNA